MSVRCAALASPEGGGGELKSLRLQKKFFCGRWAKMALLIQKVADPWYRPTTLEGPKTLATVIIRITSKTLKKGSFMTIMAYLP